MARTWQSRHGPGSWTSLAGGGAGEIVGWYGYVPSGVAASNTRKERCTATCECVSTSDLSEMFQKIYYQVACVPTGADAKSLRVAAKASPAKSTVHNFSVKRMNFSTKSIYFIL